MRILWICNQMPPVVAESLQLQPTNKEGWIAGILEQIKKEKSTRNLEIGICFPIPDSLKKVYESQDGEGRELLRGEADGFSYFGIVQDNVNLHFYDFKVERQMESIIGQFRPDMLHIFGTEYPHALAAAKAFNRPERILVGLQGIMSACADAYFADLPEKVMKRFTFRDWLKRDNIQEQQEKFALRAEHETQLLRIAGHVTGRTEFDRKAALRMHPSMQYHFMNETMRSNFYEGETWNEEDCQPHRIFVSQGNYPLKGLHKVLEALPLIREMYPDVTVHVAGDVITAHGTWKEKLKISSYGKYLLDLMKKNQCTGQVTFLGKLDAEQMKQEYLQANVFVSASSMENSSNSIGEAMLLGVPVVSSRVGGLESLLTDEQDGLFYAFSDEKELARRVMRVFENRELAEKLSENARLRALQNHDPQKNFARLMEIYQEILHS